MAREEPDLKKIIEGVIKKYNADVFIYSGSIDDAGYGRVAKEVTNAHSMGSNENALLILTTNGGLANPAFQIARIFQNTYKKFYLFTPAFCKSAGTIIALGAHKLFMDIFSELGPLDVQLYKENEILGRKSGLLSKSTFESLNESTFELFEQFLLKITMASQGNVGFRAASEISAQIASSVMAGVYSQINPDVVGSDYRDLNVAIHYGLRLARISRNADMLAVYKLVHEYPSHDFIIDNEEAVELFNSVEYPSSELYQLVGCLGETVYDEASPTVVAYLNPDGFGASEEEDEEEEKEEKSQETGESDEYEKVDRKEEVAASGEGDRGSDSGAGDPAGSAPDHAIAASSKEAAAIQYPKEIGRKHR